MNQMVLCKGYLTNNYLPVGAQGNQETSVSKVSCMKTGPLKTSKGDH